MKFIVVIVCGLPVQLILDTGVAISLVRKDVWDRLGGAGSFGLSTWRGNYLIGSKVPVFGVTTIHFQMANQMVMADLVVVHSLRVESILELDLDCIIDLPKKVLYLNGSPLQLQHCVGKCCNSNEVLVNEVRVSLTETIRIPAHSKMQTTHGVGLEELIMNCLPV